MFSGLGKKFENLFLHTSQQAPLSSDDTVLLDSDVLKTREREELFCFLDESDSEEETRF